MSIEDMRARGFICLAADGSVLRSNEIAEASCSQAQGDRTRSVAVPSSPRYIVSGDRVFLCSETQDHGPRVAAGRRPGSL